MSTPKKNPGRALQVTPSDFADIPFPNILCQGYSDDGDTNIVIDYTATFITSGVKTGDIIYFTGVADMPATIVDVIDQNTLTLNGPVRTAPSSYIVYAGPDNGGSSDGCIIYSGTGGDIEVKTIGGDYVVFKRVPYASYLPVKVLAVLSNQTDPTITNIVAFW